MRLIACLAAAAVLVAAEADPLAALPVLPRPQPAVAAQPPVDPAAGAALGPGVRFVPASHVVLDGRVQIDRGPADGLEVLACLRDGKTHEALIRLDTNAGDVVKAACLAAFGPKDGKPAEEGRGVPARGLPVRLTVQWRDEDGAWRSVDAAALVRDRRTDRPYPPLPWVWTGSRILLVTETGPDGKPVRRERFMLDSTRSVAVNFDEPDALLASPFPVAGEDQRFEVNSAIAPPAGTVVQLILAPAQPVLGMRLQRDGTLLRGDMAFPDKALGEQLAEAYGVEAKPAHRALFLQVSDEVGDEQLVATRQRILAVAAQAKAWVVPLFVPE
ncbi:MAG: hypothetical protein RL456_3445 [Pseudomonadota bacterium]|jgi:hypothetical protein